MKATCDGTLRNGAGQENDMKANDLIAKAKLIRDAGGNRKAVQIDWATWEDLLEFLEDLEDIAEIERFRASGEKTVHWDLVKAELRGKGIDV